MYRHCIYCSADLKANQAIEGFPVGRIIAFDAAKGRLWAVCPKCGRWNLAPIEERWEPIEEAERLFRDARTRVQRENIGLASVPGGERLVRIGSAQGRELAAWRYGDEMVSRGRRAAMVGVASMAGMVALSVFGAPGIAATLVAGGILAWRATRGDQVLLPPSSAEGRVPLRMRHLTGMRIDVGDDGGLVVDAAVRVGPDGQRRPLRLEGDAARGLLQRAVSRANTQGADRAEVAAAVDAVREAGSPDAFLMRTLRGGRAVNLAGGITDWEAEIGALWTLRWYDAGRRVLMPDLRFYEPAQKPASGTGLSPVQRVGIEIALNDEQERRALNGELAVLQAAWREAEEIAGIADRLALVPGEG